MAVAEDGWPGPSPLSDARAWRDRLIGSRRFQRWAARFPIVRRFARRDGERLFDLMAGFVYSQVLQACVELELFRLLRDGPIPAFELAGRAGLDPERMDALCMAAVGLGLLERRRDGTFRLGRLGAAMLGVPGLEAMVRHHSMFYRDLANPVALLRRETETELAQFWPYVLGAGVSRASADTYSELMAGSQALVAEETLKAVHLDDATHLMDVGGGTGAFLSAVATAWPKLRLTLFDLKEVAAAAASRFENAGISNRTAIVGGSFRAGSLPTGADAISLVRVLYDHTDETVANLLALVHAALPPRGLIVISEPMSGGAQPTRFGDGYFSFYTMAMGTGHVRAPKKIGSFLATAGFADIRCPRTSRPFITQVVTARKPA